MPNMTFMGSQGKAKKVRQEISEKQHIMVAHLPALHSMYEPAAQLPAKGCFDPEPWHLKDPQRSSAA